MIKEIPLAKIKYILLDMDGTLLDLYFDDYFWGHLVPEKYAEKHDMSFGAAKEYLYNTYKSHEKTLNWCDIDFWSRELRLDIPALKEQIRHLIEVPIHVGLEGVVDTQLLSGHHQIGGGLLAGPERRRIRDDGAILPISWHVELDGLVLKLRHGSPRLALTDPNELTEPVSPASFVDYVPAARQRLGDRRFDRLPGHLRIHHGRRD